MAMLALSSAGREEEIVASVSPGEGVLGSPTRFILEEDKGAALVLVDLEI
jgi:hypothetical protein